MKRNIEIVNKILFAIIAALLSAACAFGFFAAGGVESGDFKHKAFAEERAKLEKVVLSAEKFGSYTEGGAENEAASDFNFYGKVNVGNDRVVFAGGASAETKKETKFFNAFISGVKGESLRFAFGENYVKVDTATKKITLYVGGVKTETELSQKTNLSEYYLYIQVENGKYTETVVNDRYVFTYTAGGVKVGIAGAGEAEYKAFDFVAEREMKEFSYGKIAIDATGGELSLSECKIFPIDTDYEIPTRDYDEKDDEVIREEKPERLTDKQKKQKTLFIAIIAGGCAAVIAIAAGTTIIIVKRRGRRK